MKNLARKYLPLFLVAISLIITIRFLVEVYMSKTSNQKMKIYCENNGLNYSVKDVQKNREMEIFRSIYDYTIHADATHRVRFYVTIFGRSEQHTLVE